MPPSSKAGPRLLALLMAVSLAAVEPSIPLVVDGQSRAQIVLPAAAQPAVFPEGETLEYAAQFLRRYVRRASGVSLEVVREPAAAPGVPHVFLGPTAPARAQFGDFTAFAPEELAIRTVGTDVVIAGEIHDGVDRGTLFGVYEFLERVFGVGWYFANDRWYAANLGVCVPEHPSVTVQALDVRDHPAFRRRQGGLGYYTWKDEDLVRAWHPVLRFGSSAAFGQPNHSQGSWTALYGETHPEYFAMTASGRRVINFRYPHRSYICLSNPAVLEQKLRHIEAFDRGEMQDQVRPPPDAGHVYFACNDGMTPETVCHCPDCAPWLRPDGPVYGYASELYFRFVRRFALAVDERWPGRRLAVLAYGYYKMPPRTVDIPANVDVLYVGPPIHYANDPAVYAAAATDLRRWSEMLGNDSRRLGEWMNIVSPTKNVSWVPFMYPNVLARWLREHREMTDGFFVNGLNSHLRRLGDVGIYGTIQTYPMIWLQSRLLWNPDQDVDELLDRFCRDLYGPAADTMHDFYRLVTSRWEGCVPNPSMAEIDFIHQVRYPAPVRAQFVALLDQAFAETAEGSMQRERIRYYRDEVYSRFLAENERYLYWADRLPTFTCYHTGTPPTVDGTLDDACWQNLPVLHLARRQWHEPSDRETDIQVVHDGENLYLAALLQRQDETPLDLEQLRVEIATRMAAVHGCHAPNIDKRWDDFREFRLTAAGEVVSWDRVSATAAVATSRTDSTLIVEARLPFGDLAPGVDVLAAGALRMQFMRYWDIWNRYDTWSPTLSPISDFPTYRFGVLHFAPPPPPAHTGEE